MSILQRTKRLSVTQRSIVVAVLVCLAALGAAAFMRAINASIIQPNESASSAVDAQLVARTNAIDAEHVTLRATGFEPAEFTRPPGKFLLAIDNQTQMNEVGFRLIAENGSTVHDLPPKRDRYRLRQIVDLAPGRYALRVIDHPEWVCRITITAQ